MRECLCQGTPSSTNIGCVALIVDKLLNHAERHAMHKKWPKKFLKSKPINHVIKNAKEEED